MDSVKRLCWSFVTKEVNTINYFYKKSSSQLFNKVLNPTLQPLEDIFEKVHLKIYQPLSSLSHFFATQIITLLNTMLIMLHNQLSIKAFSLLIDKARNTKKKKPQRKKTRGKDKCILFLVSTYILTRIIDFSHISTIVKFRVKLRITNWKLLVF